MNKEERAEYNIKYRKSENGKAAREKYAKTDKRKAAQAKYAKTEKGKIKSRKGVSKYQKSEKGMRTRKKYRKSPEGKVSNAKTINKRQRNLGFLPLNIPFAGSNGHHVNKTVVIYIPEDLHRSVPHNVFTGGGMDEINHLAFEWLQQHGEDGDTLAERLEPSVTSLGNGNGRRVHRQQQQVCTHVKTKALCDRGGEQRAAKNGSLVRGTLSLWFKDNLLVLSMEGKKQLEGDKK